MKTLCAFILLVGSVHASLLFSNGGANKGRVQGGATMPYIGTNYTIAFWMKPTAADQFTGSEQAFVVRDNAAGTQTQIWIESNHGTDGKILDQCGGADAIKSVTAITDTNWHHVAVVQSAANSWAIYIDGALDATSATNCTPNSTANAIHIANHDSQNFGFAGNMAEVGIWSTALSAAEIATLAKGVTPNFVRMSNLLLYTPFNMRFGTGGTTAEIEPDLSGHQAANGNMVVNTGLGNVQTDNHCPCSSPAGTK